MFIPVRCECLELTDYMLNFQLSRLFFKDLRAKIPNQKLD